MNPGDIVTLVDGRQGTFRGFDRDGDLIVDSNSFGDGRKYRRDFKHYFNSLPDIASITPPGSTTMATPYDTEIANAEKALADLKAKAIAEAAAKKSALPAMADGQKWRRADGVIVKLSTYSAERGKVKFAAEGYWYYDDHRTHVNHENGDQGRLTLVELIPTTYRWYKDLAEFMAFANSLPKAILVREGLTGSVVSARAIVTGNDMFFLKSGPDVRRDDFTRFEYSVDGTTWKKFGVEE